MKYRMVTAALMGVVLVGAVLGWATGRSARPALAQGISKTAGPMADLLGGRLHPTTLKSEQIDSTYNLIGLVDAQGKPSTYATRGETFAVGGETFLVCYYVPLAISPTRPPRPKPDSTADLTLINLRAVQAMGGFTAITPPAKADETTPPKENK